MSDAPTVEIYTRPMCIYCSRAVRLLEARGVAFVEYDVWRDRFRADECRERIGQRHTYPQVFIADQAVGGFTELAELERSGDLDRRLSLAARSGPQGGDESRE